MATSDSTLLDTIPPFEGPEKKIDVEFFGSRDYPRGLRAVPTEKWRDLLTLINCGILSVIHNSLCDAYVLSESSLFVFAHKVIIKTCGQITLLRCIEELIKLGQQFCGGSVAYLNFSRRNFFFPEQQHQPHTSWEEETAYLKSHFPEGDALIFGPRSCDHHYVFVADYRKGAQELVPERPYAGHVLEILMTGLDRSVMNEFYMKPDFTNPAEVTQRTGIGALLKGVDLDAHQFEPLGYSLNGLREEEYYTIHVTPQPECSFVSFETNTYRASYEELVQQVIEVFQPESFTVLLFSETRSSMEALGTAYEGFYLRNSKHHKFAHQNHEYNLTFCSFRQYGVVSPTIVTKRPKLVRVLQNKPATVGATELTADTKGQEIAVIS